MNHVRQTLLIFALTSSGVLLLWLLWAFNAPDVARWAVPHSDTSHAASWGDAFGGFNALVSALGFAAVIATLLVQSDALRQQQHDQHRQQFDTTFFELMRLLRELRLDVEFMPSPDRGPQQADGVKRSPFAKSAAFVRKSGGDAFRGARDEIKHWLVLARKEGKVIDKELIASIYVRYIHKRFESRWSPYFRMVYTILNRLKEDAVLSDSEKATYANMLRSQLSSFEIFMIGVNGLAPVSKDMADLVTEFRMLKYLPEGSMRNSLKGIYPEKAFAART